MKRILSFLALGALILLSQCSQDGSDYVVTIKTNQGDMIAILYDETPKHKANFIKLAKEHYFDSLLFHRVIEGFMIQGGDPDSKNAQPGQPLGMGGPGYTVEAEFNPKFFHEKGALSAARLPDQANPEKASSGSQFYIVQGRVTPPAEADALKIDQAKLNTAFQQMMQNPASQPLIDTLNQIYMTGDMQGYQNKIYSLVPRLEKQTGIKIYKEVSKEKLKAYTTIGGYPPLDDEYTIFGKVISGLDVIDKIAALPKGAGDRPMEDVRMTVTVEEMPRKKITELYGYNFLAK
ncbi:MAG TPA: peptidylprolyl isomerase [Cyclobacteriaceae bacterium]|nr:peptidylprolyl isomerase [Cyclobacteriaceae bacterium]HPW61731.1 peptidylprolyl isomerase [Cyclobacteriaceae bacterium]HRG80365.1 peptidylprolyl isomerase [Cyclobacteriaceae bacterium]